MKVWAKAMVGVAGLVAAGAGGGWYVMSGNMVAMAKANIEQINAAGGGDQPKVTLSYAAIGRTMFPTIGVAVTDLAVRFELPSGAEGQAVTMDSTSKGTAQLTCNPLTREYRMSGENTVESRITHGEQTSVMRGDRAQFDMRLKAQDRAAYNTLAAMNLKEPQSILAALKGVSEASMVISPFRMTDDKGALLYSQEAFELRVKRQPQKDATDIELALLLKDSVTTEAYDAFLSTLMDGQNAPFAMPDVPFSVTRGGKQNIDVLAHVRLPNGAGSAMMADGASLELRRFAISNDFYHLTLPLVATRQLVNGDEITRIKLDGEYELTAKGGEEAKQYGIPFLQKFLGGLSGSNEGVEQRYDMIAAALPTLSTLGPVTLAVDVEANKTANSEDSASAKDQFTINRLSLNHSRWGLDVKGMLTDPAGNDAGVTADVAINCLKCDALVADGFEKARAAQAVMNYETPDRPQWRVDAAVEQQVAALLNEIGRKDAATGDVSVAITSPQPGNLMINNKSVAEVMPRILAIVAPEAAAQMPAAGGAPSE